MKSVRLLALVVCLLLPVTVFAQDVTLSTQAEVDAAATLTAVDGWLFITGADITDLSPLDGLTTVTKSILIENNPSLTVVADAFPSLTSLGWGIYVYDNDSLVSFSGFDALVSTGDNIDFWYNDALESVSGFSLLQTAGWSLEFGGNPVLTDLPDFPALTTINSSLFILDNASLEEITGFQALSYVDWSFNVNFNPSLDSLCGLYNYFSANNPYTGGGAFDISNNGPGLPSPATEQDIIDAGPCVVDPVAAVANLSDDVDDLPLSNRDKKPLKSKLGNAAKSLDKGKAFAAANQLMAFANQVNALVRSRRLDAADGAALVDSAMAIVDAINQ